jgi:nucleoside-diphosphate-sugar epimerase
MRIVVLGGTHLIGPHAVRWLVEMGHEVMVFHRGQTEASLPPSVRHLHGDRHHLSDFADDFRNLAPNVVLDLIPGAGRDGKTLVGLFNMKRFSWSAPS